MYEHDEIEKRMQEQKQDKTEITILKCTTGPWNAGDKSRLVIALETRYSWRADYKNILLLNGHYDESKVQEALGTDEFELIQVTGLNSEELPFIPNFGPSRRV